MIQGAAGREPKVLIRNLTLNAEAVDQAVADQKAEAFRKNRRYARAIFAQLQAQGYIRSDLEREYWVSRVVAWGRDDKPSMRSRLFMGIAVDATESVWRYIEDRAMHRHGGDSAITIEVRGRTGSGKSGLAITIAEHLEARAAQLRDVVHFQPRPFINACKAQVLARSKGECHAPLVIMDESNLPVGEGAGVIQEVLRNEEGRLREGGISMVFVRPNVDDEMPRDLTLEMVGVSEKSRSYLAIAFVAGEPAGFFEAKWPAPAMWEAYRPLKKNALVMRGSAESENLVREVLEVITDDARLARIEELGRDEDAAEFVIQDGLVAGLSVNASRRLVRMVLKAVKLRDDQDALAGFALQLVAGNPPYGLTSAARRRLMEWATQTHKTN